MANKWNIPIWLEDIVRKRDKRCVYCLKSFRENSKDRSTWEHIDNNAKNISELNICLCCGSCNSSKGSKNIFDWLQSPYCKDRKINQKSVSRVIIKFIKINKLLVKS